VRRIIELFDSGMNEGRMDIGAIVHSSFTPSVYGQSRDGAFAH